VGAGNGEQHGFKQRAEEGDEQRDGEVCDEEGHGLFEYARFVSPEFFDSLGEGWGFWEGCAAGDEEVDHSLVVVDTDVFAADSWGGAVDLFVVAGLGVGEVCHVVVVSEREADAGGGVVVGAVDGCFAGAAGHEFALPFPFGHVGFFLGGFW